MTKDDQYLWDKLQSKCGICPDCEKQWLWKGAKQRNKAPIYNFREKSMYPRRWVWMQKHGREPKKGHVIVSGCESTLCINPERTQEITKAESNRRTAAKGLMHTPAMRAKLAAARRANSDLSQEAVRAIRASSEPAKVEAEKYNITTTYVHMLRNGKSRKELAATPFSGLFTGLAANEQRKRA